jgi:predicted DNA-binding ribbon-helix-helix protein
LPANRRVQLPLCYLLGSAKYGPKVLDGVGRVVFNKPCFALRGRYRHPAAVLICVSDLPLCVVMHKEGGCYCRTNHASDESPEQVWLTSSISARLASESKDSRRRKTPLKVASPTDCQNPTVSLVKPVASKLAAIWIFIGLEREKLMKSPVIKRSIVIAGHKTSVSLEDAFWQGLKDIAAARDMTLSELVATIDTDRRHGNLSSGIRLFVLDHYRSQVEVVPKQESNGLNEPIQFRSVASVVGAGR